MATFVGTFKKSEFLRLLPLMVQNTDSCTTNSVTTEDIRPSEMIVLFRINGGHHYECESLKGLSSWFLQGNDTLIKSRAIVSQADVKRVIDIVNPPPPPPNYPAGPPENPDMFKFVDARNRRRRRNSRR